MPTDVCATYPFQITEHYRSLIHDGHGPLSVIALPNQRELEDWGALDASKESNYTKAPHLQHKYPDTALMLVTDVCATICRYCFRKRLFKDGRKTQGPSDLTQAFEYISQHPEITNILCTGGDTMTLKNKRIEHILATLSKFEHIKTVRFGSKMLAFQPERFFDKDLINIFKSYRDRFQIYFVSHFSCVEELVPEARQATKILQKAGLNILQQTPIIRGVNDTVEALSSLWKEMMDMGVTPYYIFQCRPTLGNYAYTVPIEEALQTFTEAQNLCSGLSKRARYCMSHATGKIEIVGMSEGRTFFKYHRAADPANRGKFFSYASNPKAYWLDDYIKGTKDA